MSNAEVFAFGAPVLPCGPSASDHRRTYVLGAYPSGLHVSWVPPQTAGLDLKPVRAMIVDNEPTPFWDGSEAGLHFDAWFEKVGWRSSWGSVKPAATGSNGPSGKWVDDHILQPLGLTRDKVCISDCLNQSRLNAGQAGRVADTYEPAAAHLGLPPSTLRSVPSGESALVSEALDSHLPRLKAELRACRPTTVVTLGNAALRVAAALLELDGPTPKALSHDKYGAASEAEFEGTAVRWLPLVHPRSGERTPPWPSIHAAWETSHS